MVATTLGPCLTLFFLVWVLSEVGALVRYLVYSGYLRIADQGSISRAHRFDLGYESMKGPKPKTLA